MGIPPLYKLGAFLPLTPLPNVVLNSLSCLFQIREARALGSLAPTRLTIGWTIITVLVLF